MKLGLSLALNRILRAVSGGEEVPGEPTLTVPGDQVIDENADLVLTGASITYSGSDLLDLQVVSDLLGLVADYPATSKDDLNAYFAAGTFNPTYTDVYGADDVTIQVRRTGQTEWITETIGVTVNGLAPYFVSSIPMQTVERGISAAMPSTAFEYDGNKPGKTFSLEFSCTNGTIYFSPVGSVNPIGNGTNLVQIESEFSADLTSTLETWEYNAGADDDLEIVRSVYVTESLGEVDSIPLNITLSLPSFVTIPDSASVVENDSVQFLPNDVPFVDCANDEVQLVLQLTATSGTFSGGTAYVDGTIWQGTFEALNASTGILYTPNTNQAFEDAIEMKIRRADAPDPEVWDDVASIPLYCYPIAPSEAACVPEEFQPYNVLSLSWANRPVGSYDSIEIWSKDSEGGEYTLRDTLDGSQTWYDDNTLEPSSQRFYQIIGIVSGISSDPCEVDGTTTGEPDLAFDTNNRLYRYGDTSVALDPDLTVTGEGWSRVTVKIENPSPGDRILAGSAYGAVTVAQPDDFTLEFTSVSGFPAVMVSTDVEGNLVGVTFHNNDETDFACEGDKEITFTYEYGNADPVVQIFTLNERMHTVWVDEISGNNATGQVNNEAAPYQTLLVAGDALNHSSIRTGYARCIRFIGDCSCINSNPEPYTNFEQLLIDGLKVASNHPSTSYRIEGFLPAAYGISNPNTIILDGMNIATIQYDYAGPDDPQRDWLHLYGLRGNETVDTISAPGWAGNPGSAPSDHPGTTGYDGGEGTSGYGGSPGEPGENASATAGDGNTGDNGSDGMNVHLHDVTVTSSVSLQGGTAGDGSRGGDVGPVYGGQGGQGGNADDDGEGTPYNGGDGGAGGNADAYGGNGGLGGDGGVGGNVYLYGAASITGSYSLEGGAGGLGGVGGATSGAIPGFGGAGGLGINGGADGNPGADGTPTEIAGADGNPGTPGSNGSVITV